LRFQRVRNVSAFRAGRVLSRLILESELDSRVAILVFCADLEDGAGAKLQDGHGGGLPLFVIHLRHPNLGTEKTDRHGKSHRNAGNRLRRPDVGKRLSIPHKCSAASVGSANPQKKGLGWLANLYPALS